MILTLSETSADALRILRDLLGVDREVDKSVGPCITLEKRPNITVSKIQRYCQEL
jgi:hypothetical protein